MRSVEEWRSAHLDAAVPVPETRQAAAAREAQHPRNLADASTDSSAREDGEDEAAPAPGAAGGHGVGPGAPTHGGNGPKRIIM